MTGNSLRQVLRYRFDSFMARGGRSIFIVLVLVFISILVSVSLLRGALLLTVPADVEPKDFIERGDGFFHNMYITFLQMTDPGNMNQDIDSKSYFKAPAILAGLAGVVMLSSLIAFITTTLDQKIGELKKGHSKVIEDGHTLILGWNQRVVEILRELIIANENQSNPCVVILSKLDKEEMDDFLKLHLKDTANTRVITRSGSISSLVNLDVVSVDACKSIIVLAECGVTANDGEKIDSDTMVIKTVLGVVAGRPPGKRLDIVAEIFFPDNRSVVQDVAPGEVTTIDTNLILAKILVQTSRSIGLSVVYSEILSFDGSEMYFHHADWGEINFGELAFRFPDGVPMGLRHADGRITLRPPVDLTLRADDDVLILAQDDSTIDFQSRPVAQPRPSAISDARLKSAVERNLIIGWTPKVPTMVAQYADYVLYGSRIDIMLRAPSRQVRQEIDRLDQQFPQLQFRLVEENPFTVAGLMSVKVLEYDNIIILSQGDRPDDHERTDSQTILILLLLRKIFDQHPDRDNHTKLITEVLDSENESLVQRTGVDDFIISNRFVSMLLAQVSEDCDIKRVYDNLFEEAGSAIYLKPASLYFTVLPQEATFADMILAAQQRHEVCLGVKIKEHERDSRRNFGITLIPEKDTSYRLTADDTLVVLAEDQT